MNSFDINNSSLKFPPTITAIIALLTVIAVGAILLASILTYHVISARKKATGWMEAAESNEKAIGNLFLAMQKAAENSDSNTIIDIEQSKTPNQKSNSNKNLPMQKLQVEKIEGLRKQIEDLASDNIAKKTTISNLERTIDDLTQSLTARQEELYNFSEKLERILSSDGYKMVEQAAELLEKNQQPVR